MQISYAGEAKKEKLDIKVMDNSFYTEENLFFDNSENAVEKLEVDNSFLDLTGSAVPSYYSSVDKGHTSSVKDQASYGTCWSFATVAAIESYLIKNNIAKSNVDLSEAQLTYFTYNQPTYNYGNVHNDKMINKTTTHYLFIGGNYYMSTLAMAKGIGLASENVMPYSGLGYSTKYNNELAFKSEYMLKNSYFINMGDQLAIKNAVIKYGSVACTM
jgi:C1A family cysteine protease